MRGSPVVSKFNSAGLEDGYFRSRGMALFVVLTLAGFGSARAEAASQISSPQFPADFPLPRRPKPVPPPPPLQVPANPAGAAFLDVTSNFLERWGQRASGGANGAWKNNPDGGGASAATDGPRFRSWIEAYGVAATNAAQANFAGDRRQTYGGVAGLSARLMDGVNIGVSLDQSSTAITVPLALQTAKLEMTQFGIQGSIDKGPWTWAFELVHGIGRIGSSRDTGFGMADANYHGKVDGALTELSYYWSLDQSRVVPKAALEYVRASTDAFQENGGFGAVSASGVSMERARLLAGVEVGHYWIFDQKILDLLAYGKFVDNFVQNVGSATVSLGPQTIIVQGIGESQFGADAGASASLNINRSARLYVNYDGKFRTTMQSNQGTLGVELKW